MSHRKPWYERALTEKKKEVMTSAALAVLFALSVTLRHYFTGATFAWQSISPIEAPGLLPRLFYSALVFVGPGWFLYHKLKFWKFLYEPYRGGGRSAYREYQKLKTAIWGLLILLMYFVIVPFVVDVLNAVISFLYNLLILAVYLLPSVCFAAIVFGVGYYAMKRLRK